MPDEKKSVGDTDEKENVNPEASSSEPLSVEETKKIIEAVLFAT